MVSIPTLSQLYADILADLESRLNVSIPLFGKSFLRALAAVQAAKLKLFYLALGNIQKNIFVDTADSEASGGTLERFGRVKLGRGPFTATAGKYSVGVTGTAGATIAASTTFKSNDDSLNPGKMYVLDIAYVLTGSDTITLRALESGIESRLNIGDKLTATAPIANVESLVEVISEVVEPLKAEDTEEYRQKAIEAYQLEPQGGAATDYRLWAADAQGVRQTYPFAKSGAANEINLYVEATIADSIDGKGTPSGAMLEDVEDVIELDPDTTKPINERGRRPLGVFQVHCLPVTPKNIDIVITGYQGLTPAIQTTNFNALKEALSNIRPFVSAADVLAEKNDILSTNKVIFVIQDAQPSSLFTSLSMSVAGAPVSSYTFTGGEIPHLNTVSYV